MMIDLKELGNRLRQIRNRMELSQKALAGEIGVTQTALSRLENGEEVYASVLLAYLTFLQSKVSLDSLFSTDFSLDSHWLNCHSEVEARQFIIRHLDILRDIINSYHETGLQQLDFMKREMAE